jgi:hypothetical protein
MANLPPAPIPPKDKQRLSRKNHGYLYLCAGHVVTASRGTPRVLLAGAPSDEDRSPRRAAIRIDIFTTWITGTGVAPSKPGSNPHRESNVVKSLLIAVFAIFLCQFAVHAQTAPQESAATKIVQESEQLTDPAPAQDKRTVKVPAGTPLEIEAVHTVRSVDVRPNDYLSFRVLVPIRIGDVTVIEKDALVTGRVVQAKRGGRWGKAGKLSWIMTDVIAVDLSRIPVQISNDSADNRNRIRGISHGGEVAARAIVLGALFPPAAAIGVIGGAFKRGGDAILPEGKRFVIYVQKDTDVTVRTAP